MARIVVPRAEALTTALGTSSRGALVTLANALAEEAQQTNNRTERHQVIRMFLSVVKAIDGMDRSDQKEARALARAEAAMDWMGRRDEERNKAAAARAAVALAKARPKPGPASALIDELRVARENRVKRTSAQSEDTG